MIRWVSIATLAFVGAISMSASALEFSAGVGVGAAVVGSRPRLATTPHAGVSWLAEGGFLLGAHATLGILPAVDEHGAGVSGQASAALGFRWKRARFSIGPALSIYSLPACGAEHCARLRGLAPGGRAQVELYFIGPLGLSLSASADWLTGSAVLPGGLALSAMAGPIVTWGGK